MQRRRRVPRVIASNQFWSLSHRSARARCCCERIYKEIYGDRLGSSYGGGFAPSVGWIRWTVACDARGLIVSGLLFSRVQVEFDQQRGANELAYSAHDEHLQSHPGER
eukprot:9503959-Pyramimonas_sp.AAC.1